jgi:hypothetical protein
MVQGGRRALPLHPLEALMNGRQSLHSPGYQAEPENQMRPDCRASVFVNQMLEISEKRLRIDAARCPPAVNRQLL